MAAACLLIPLSVTKTVLTEKMFEAGQAHGIFGATAVALSAGKLAIKANTAQLQATLQDLSLKDPQLSRILVVDTKGLVVFDSKAELQDGLLDGFEGAWGDTKANLVTVEDGSVIVRAEAPIFAENGIWGIVRTDYRLDAASEFASVVDRCALFSALGAIPAALGITWFVIRRFLRSLARCTYVLDQGAQGNTNLRTGFAPRNELAGLVDSVDKLIGRIQEDSKKSKERCEVLEERLAARANTLDKLTVELEELKELTKQP